MMMFYGMDKVVYTVALGIDAVRQENKTTYSTAGKLVFGEAEGPDLTDRIKRVQSLFDRAGIDYEISDVCR